MMSSIARVSVARVSVARVSVAHARTYYTRANGLFNEFTGFRDMPPSDQIITLYIAALKVGAPVGAAGGTIYCGNRAHNRKQNVLKGAVCGFFAGAIAGPIVAFFTPFVAVVVLPYAAFQYIIG